MTSRSIAELTGKRQRKATPKLKVDWALADNLMGIELEIDSPPTEHAQLREASMLNYWNVHQDGSLINGREFVLRTPMAGDELSRAIAEIMAYGPFKKNVTGSTHVHLDMVGSEDQPTTHETLRILILMVYALEPVLYAIGDRGRAFCGFCNTLESANDSLIKDAMNLDITPDEFIRNYRKRSTNNSRYYGFNMLSLGEYGSLEFRYFPMASTSEELVRYVQLVQTFKRAACTLRDVDELIAIFSDSEQFRLFIEREFSQFIDLFRENISFAQAAMAVEKVRSICALSNRKNISPLDISKITSSKKWKSILGKKKAPAVNATAHIHYIANSGRIPDAPNGDVLVYSRNVYVRYENDWRGIGNFRAQDFDVLTRQYLRYLLNEDRAREAPALDATARRLLAEFIEPGRAVPPPPLAIQVPEEETDFDPEDYEEDDE